MDWFWSMAAQPKPGYLRVCLIPSGLEFTLWVRSFNLRSPAEFAEKKNGKSLWTDKQITTGIACGLHCRECIPRHAAGTWTCTNGFRGVTNIVHCDILPEFHSYFELLGGGSHISRSSGTVLENLCFRCGRSIALCEGDVAAYNLSPQLSDVSSGSQSGHLHVSPTTAVT
ncbi:hypothetical protein ALC56_08547 [Trachymyrmex septentrionalis]|uniref:Uncharacterized protein n=1 Tax=Trachymyrmex septentrionalis TaxID=34720 RepID=A0A195F8P9_9HYME|nr:hypothetical protein ALC56_08547 [Trachymyrmex septentrionalis]